MDVVQYIDCGCGNPKKESYFDKDTGEGREMCDVCGYFSDVVIVNKPEDGNTPPDFKPQYIKEYGKTGFVLKIFSKDGKYYISAVSKKGLKKLRKQLDDDPNIVKYAITFKDINNNYQTQIFK